MSEDGKTKVMSMRKVLPLNLIDEASKILGTKNIWLNTGTIWRIYTSDTRIEPNERWQTLNSLLMYLRVLKLRWYTPIINIFSQNNLDRNSEKYRLVIYSIKRKISRFLVNFYDVHMLQRYKSDFSTNKNIYWRTIVFVRKNRASLK